jgi:hypothetical protein
MYIKLIRNAPKGSAITGRLVIDGRWFCNTLERKGYEILALCYHVCVTQSPKFKRLLPLVCGVPSSVESCRIVEDSVESSSAEKTMLNHSTQPLHKATPCAMRSGIRFHRGTKPQHSTGCILVVADNNNDNTDNLRGNQLPAALKENIPCRSRDIDSSGTLSPLSSNNNSPLSSKHSPVGARSVAEVENQLTQLLLQSQNDHEAVILEVIDFRPGTEYGYNTPCPIEIQKR